MKFGKHLEILGEKSQKIGKKNGNLKNLPRAFDLSMGRPCRPLSHIIIKYPTGGSELHLHQLGQVFGEPAAIKYNECTGTIEIEKVFGRLQGT